MVFGGSGIKWMDWTDLEAYEYVRSCVLNNREDDLKWLHTFGHRNCADSIHLDQVVISQTTRFLLDAVICQRSIRTDWTTILNSCWISYDYFKQFSLFFFCFTLLTLRVRFFWFAPRRNFAIQTNVTYILTYAYRSARLFFYCDIFGIRVGPIHVLVKDKKAG